MSAVDVLAVLVTDGKSIPVASKSGLKNLLYTSPELVRFVPVNPSPALVSATPANAVPFGTVFLVHNPAGRKWSATVGRTESSAIHVK